MNQKANTLLRDLRQGSLPRLQWRVDGDKTPARELSEALSAATKRWDAAGSALELVAQIAVLEASRQKLRSETKTWPWFTERDEGNPAYDAIQAKVGMVEARLAQAEAALDQGGRGRADREALATQVEQWQQALADLVVEREKIPMVSRVRERHDLPYTDEMWQAKGHMAVSFDLPSGDPMVREASYEKTDILRTGARPEVGLEATNLDLPADEAAIRRILIRRLVEEWMPVLRRRVVVSQVVVMQRAADAAQKTATTQARWNCASRPPP